MKIKGKKTSDNETSVTIDIFEGVKVSSSVKKQVIKEVGEYLVEQTLLNVSQKQSPVSGGKWKKSLSPSYAKIKQEEVGNKDANLELTGETLDSLAYKAAGDDLKIGVFGSRAVVLDGHTNLSGKSKLPERRVLPDEGEVYKSNIDREIKRIVADAIVESSVPKNKDVSQIETKTELYEYLQSLAKVKMSRSELRLFALRSSDIINLLERNEIIDLL